MSDSEREALLRAVREVASEPAPEPDWERIEHELFQKLDSEPKPTPVSIRRKPWQAIGGLAAAAALAAGAFLVFNGSSIEPTGVVENNVRNRETRVEANKVDGRRLNVGDRVRSDAEEVRIDHPGQANWTLSPNSSAVLVQSGASIVVRLEAGVLSARVVSVPRAESFAVLVDDVRVAVHGTVFRVERLEHRAHVEVSEGSVAVGATLPHARRWLLRAPARGQFTLDGKIGTIDGAHAASPALRGRPDMSNSRGAAPDEAEATGAPTTPDPSSASSTEQAPRPPAELPSKPSIGELEDGVSRLIDAVNGCFAQHTQTGGEMQVTARSTVTLTIAPDGRITAQRFSPPLAPSVQGCSATKLAKLRFAASKEGISVTRNIEFGLR